MDTVNEESKWERMKKTSLIAEGVLVGDALGVLEVVGDGVGDGVREMVAVAEGVGEPDGVEDEVLDGVSDGVAVGVVLGVWDGVALRDGLGVAPRDVFVSYVVEECKKLCMQWMAQIKTLASHNKGRFVP